jgi:cation diffusion facilitator family transporter
MNPQKSVLVVSLISFVLSIAKIIVAILSNSITIMASAIDSMLDTFISLFNLYALKKSKQKPDDKFNYGLGKMEALATILEGTLIFISGLYIIYIAIKKYYLGNMQIVLDISIYIMIISSFFSTINVLILKHSYKKTKNMLIKADIAHYSMDIWVSISILSSLVLIYFTNLLIIDVIFGLLAGIYILYSAYTITREGILNILDYSLEDKIITNIKDIIKSHSKATGHHLLKTRKSAGVNFVEFHLEINPYIRLVEAYEISNEVENQIKHIDTNEKWIVTIKLDPYKDILMH